MGYKNNKARIGVRAFIAKVILRDQRKSILSRGRTVR
jgi:hypothetical protein